ncbi:hypothetical protein V8E53_005369 [Lactarius tabidus]
MPTDKAANPTKWTICSGQLLDKDSEDSDFPSDQDPDAWSSDLSSSSNLSIISGNHKEAHEAKAQAAKEACEAMKARAAKEWEACAAKEQEACAAEEREAHAAEEQEAHTAQQPSTNNDNPVPEDGAGEEDEERQDVLLTDEQVNILQRQVAGFRGTNNPDTRSTIIQDVVSQFERSWGHDMDFNRELIQTATHRYLYNRCKWEQKTPYFHRKWMYMDIMINVHCQEVGKLAAQLSGAKPGKIMSRGKAMDRAKASSLGTGASTLWEFSEMIHSQYGAWVAVLVGCDNNHKLGSTSFKDCYKQWQNEPFVDNFSKWTSESFGLRVQPNNDHQEIGKKDLAVNIKLQKDSQGYPILPSWEVINREGHVYKRYLIGKYLSELYEITAGGHKGRVPWAKLQEARDEFILPKYLPDDFTLTQYHHICINDADSLLRHWMQRQAAGEIPFQFKNILMAKQHKKLASAGDSTPTPAGRVGQLDGGQQDTGSNQERGSNREHQEDAAEAVSNKLRQGKNHKCRERLEWQTKPLDHLPIMHLKPLPQHPDLLWKSIPITTNAAADACLPKHQNVGNGMGNVQPEPQQSTCALKPSEWCKQTQMFGRKGAQH